MPAPQIDIHGSGKSFGIYFKGQQVGQANSYDNACVRARTAENRLQQRARNCMCCGATFTAAGRFLRLCDHCKETFA